MPQETNLNVAPYFDDYNSSSNYYKVLFKPAYPVQARELNNLQSILQNQIEQFGDHTFKEGAKVIPGQLTYLKEYQCIQIEETFLGVPVELYLDKIIGQTITGATSGVTAQVVNYITKQESERGNCTLYINYFESSTTDAETSTFVDDEVLLLGDSITYSTTFIASGEGFAKAITEEANATGSAYNLNEGVYYLRGHFVSVYDDTLILDQYTNTPSYRIGLNVREEVISSEVDPELNDNAQGFTNYAAPGADRMRISATLAKKLPDDFEDTNFIQLSEVKDGVLRENKTTNNQYEILGDEMARRTFDESGHYYVKPYQCSVKESLNNKLGNRGLFDSNQTTEDGNTPSDDLAVVKVLPGKAYVKGYEVNTVGPVYLDSPKPRTTKTLKSQAVNFGFGPSFTLNRVTGAPTIAINSDNFVSMRSERRGSGTGAEGIEIGVCRVYDFVLESGSYDTTAPELNQWDIALFDVQTYTSVTLNRNITLSVPTYVEGKNSGATAFLRNAASNTTSLTLYDVKGEFVLGEKLVFDNDETSSRTIIDITNYEISDVQSLRQGNTFLGDIIPSTKETVGIAAISAASGSESIITSPSVQWVGIASVGNLVQYSVSTNNVPSLARVKDVTPNDLTVEAVPNLPSFRIGTLPTSNINVTDLKIVETRKQQSSSGGNASDGESIFSAFAKRNVESVDLTSSTLIIRKEFTVNISGNKSDSVSTGSNETFMPFDEERYTLIRSNGSFEVLTQDKFNFSAGNTGLIIKGLGANDTGARLMTTIKKSKIKEKVKRNNISGSVIIDKSTNPSSGTGSDTSDDGLVYGNYPYGTRVQDDSISLGVPDVQQIYAIYESEGTDDPVIPNIITSFLDGPTKTTDDLIVGELFIGATSGAIGFYFQKNTDVSVDYIARNKALFLDGETITFQTSGITAQVSAVNVGDENIVQNFALTRSQRKTFYDVSRIERFDDSPVPSSKIRVCFSHLDYDSSDDGDITVTNSYDNVKYSNISSVDGFRNSDLVDARPRVSQYNVTEDARSPFEFFGRSFTSGQHSSKEVLASDESMVVDYSYYLPRADRVYVNKEGEFSVKFGTPSDRPQLPDPISNQMEIATVTMPAYLFNVNDAEIKFVDHKRYQMSDIAKLEKRISNLEYYSALSQLETATVNQFTPDANGLNRFKSGIFVDNFTTLITQDPNIGIKNCIDRKTKSLRPSHYTNSVDLQLGTTDTTNSDSKFAPIDGSNVVRNENVLMLQYEDREWLKNPFATRVVNVTPYMVTFWAGSITLTPDTDVWIDVNIMEPNNVEIGDSGLDAINEIMGFDVVTNEDGSRTGIGPVVWDSWETVGVQRETEVSSSITTDVSSRTSTSTQFVGRDITRRDVRIARPRGNPRRGRETTTTDTWLDTTITDTTTDTTTTTTSTTTTTTDQERSGNQLTLSETTQTESLGSAVVSREVIHYMRSRNIECVSTSMKPYTRLYSFFDNMDVNKYCTPKLIEIQMRFGTFQVGETVRGYMMSSFNNRNVSETSIPSISFRVAVSNHKYGPYNNPSTVYDSNPYNKDLSIPPSYSETSSTLNVDTFSLQDEKEPDYSGYIAPTMILIGQTSGAAATVTNVRLVSDRVGTMIYNFLVPSSNDSSAQVFETGQSRMRLTTSNTNSKVEGIVTSSAEATFYSEGTLDNTQETTLSVKNLVVGNVESSESRTLVDVDVDVDVSVTSFTTRDARTSTRSRSTTRVTQVDPLAQSFFVDDETGIFLSSIDVFFQSKPTTARTPVICQLREMELGTPTTRILPYSNVEVDPITITTSQDATVPTNIKFKAPVYLNGQTEYCVVFLSHNTEYTVWVSKLGEPDISTIGSEEGQILVSTQPLLGSLFKSQNASTWTPSQYEDLTFTLYRADFATEGNAQFYNPNLPKNIELISKDNVQMISKEVKIQSSAAITADIKPGETVTQANTNATGNFQNFGGSASGSLIISNVGVGYTPSDSTYYTFTGVALTSITGSGINATADITISDGIAIGATIVSGGTGHQIGDVLAPISIGNDSLGVSMALTVDALSGTNQLILSGVQGDFSTNTADTLSYKPTAGVSSALSVYPLSPIDEINNGKEFVVNFRNHGMHSTSNVVKLSNLEGTINVKLSSTYSRTSTGPITIVSTTGFTQFEGVNVGANNPGYIRIGNEIISYTGLSGNTLTGITRGVDNTVVQTWNTGSLVRKYEMNGVSLRRINAEHYLGSSGDNEAITLDSYKIEIDMGDTTRGIDRSSSGSFRSLYFNKTRNGGGINGRSTYNQQFELIIPKFTYITPQGTSVSGTIRTTSGTSISGSEPSFIDQGFSDLTFNGKNYFDSPRIISSRVNELLYLKDQPKNKSLTVNMNLSSDDSRLSPVIDLDKTSCTFTTNRVNSVIENYADDFRANTVKNDPTKFIYTHRSVVLENPATSIEVTLDAYITNDHDIRLFYALDQDVPLKDIVFIPFPGYKNQDTSRPGAIKDPSKSDGTSDTLTPKSDSAALTPSPAQFTEYKFTADLLPQFTQFKIKVLATSTNQAVVPQIRNIRVVSLA